MGQAPLLRGQTALLPVLEACGAHHGEDLCPRRHRRQRSLEPDDLAFRGEQHDLEEMLGNLVDNACKWAEGAGPI